MKNNNLIKRLDSIRIDIDNMVEDIRSQIDMMPKYSTENERAHKKELQSVSNRLTTIICNLTKPGK